MSRDSIVVGIASDPVKAATIAISVNIVDWAQASREDGF